MTEPLTDVVSYSKVQIYSNANGCYYSLITLVPMETASYSLYAGYRDVIHACAQVSAHGSLINAFSESLLNSKRIFRIWICRWPSENDPILQFCRQLSSLKFRSAEEELFFAVFLLIKRRKENYLFELHSFYIEHRANLCVAVGVCGGVGGVCVCLCVWVSVSLHTHSQVF